MTTTHLKSIISISRLDSRIISIKWHTMSLVPIMLGKILRIENYKENTDAAKKAGKSTEQALNNLVAELGTFRKPRSGGGHLPARRKSI